MTVNAANKPGIEGTPDIFGDYAVLSVPEADRKSFLSIMVTTAAWIINLGSIFSGGSLATGMSFNQVVWASIIGMLILVGYGVFQAFVGARYGVSTTMLARYCFGRQGTKLFGSIIVIISIGWYAWQLTFFGLTINELFPDVWWAHPRVAAVWGSVLMIITAMMGYRGLATLSYVALPFVVILSIIGLNRAVVETGSWTALSATAISGQSIPFFTAVTIVVGNAAVGFIIIPDISRYGKSMVSGGMAAMIGATLGGLFSLLAGAAMVSATSVPGIGTLANIPAAMAALGLGVWAFFILVFAQWTTNDNNLYTASLGSSNIVNIPKRWHVLIIGIIGTVLASIGVANFFVPFLVFLGTYMPPFAGVMIVDYWIINRLIEKKEYRFGPGTVYSQWNIIAFISVIASGFISSKIGFGIAAVNSILIAAALYVFLSQVAKAFKIPYCLGESIEDESGF